MKIFKFFKLFIFSGVSISLLLICSFIGCSIFWVISRIINYLLGFKYFKFSLLDITKDLAGMQKRQTIYDLHKIQHSLNIKNEHKNNSDKK